MLFRKASRSPSVKRSSNVLSRSQAVGISTLILVLTFQSVNPAQAFDRADPDKAMRSIRSANWYDSETNSYAPPEIKQATDNSIREDGFSSKSSTNNSESFWDSFWDFFDWDWNWGGAFGAGAADIFSMVIITVMALVIVAILAVLIIHILKSSGVISSKASKTLKKLEIDPVRVEDLPFEVERSDIDPLDEARRLLAAGDARQSIIYLYGYMLLVLDHARKIYLQKGKTNRMYLSELNTELELKAILERTILVFEEAYFGRYPVSSERAQQVWSELDAFHTILEVQVDQPSNTSGASS